MIFESLLEPRSWAWQNRHPSEGGVWWDDAESQTGLIVTEVTALANTAVYQAVQLIAGMMAAVPKFTYRKDAEGNPERAEDHALYNLLRYQPNRETTAFSFTQAGYLNKLTGGNFYAEIERGPTGAPVALWQLPAWIVEPHRVYKRTGGGLTTSLGAATPEDRKRGGEVWYEVQVENGRPVWLRSDDVFHVPGLSFNGLKGFSPIRVAMESIAVGLAMQKSAAAIFGNKAEPGVVLERPETAPALTPAGERALVAAFEASHRGIRKRGRVAVLQEGTKATSIQTNLRELQFVESIKHNIPEVARIFNVPAYFLGHDGSQNTYSNVEGEWIRLTRQTLMPHAEGEQQEARRKLISEGEAASLFVEYEFKALLKGDSAARATFLEKMLTLGVMSTETAAKLENLPPPPEKKPEPDAAPAPPVPPAAPPSRMLLDRLEAVVRASMQRVVTREVREIRREIERSGGDLARFLAWTDTYYQRDLPDFLAEVAGPAVGDPRADELAWAYAAAHRAQLRRSLEGHAEPDPALALLDTWTETAAAETARAECALIEGGIKEAA